MRRWIGGAALMLAIAATGLVPRAAGAKCVVGQMLELKVTMEGMRPMVEATIDGHAERFLADSGAFYSTISPGKAAELALHPQPLPPNFRIEGIGGSQAASLAVVKSLGLAGLSLRDIQFLVGGSEVAGSAGLLGQNVLGIADVEYDLAHGEIRLLRAHGCKDAQPVYWTATSPISAVTIEPRSPSQPHTIGTVTVNGVRMRAIFDTGAGRSVMSLAAAARIGLKPGSPGVRAAGYASGIGRGTVPNYVIPLDSIALGDGETIHRTHIQAAAIGLDEADMLIGADFFLSHRVYVANGLHRLFFTYDGGPVFNVTPSRVVSSDGTAVPAPEGDAAAPVDAAGYAGRGAARLARHDAKGALADLDEAVRLAPGDARYVFGRAEARLRAGDRAGALADLDTAVRLAPDDPEPRLARAQMRFGRHDRDGAAEDVVALDKALPPAADRRFALAGLYGALDRPVDEIAQWDQWLRFHPDDSRRPAALNGRCWARAQANRDLPKALSDCDGAIKARPNAASYLDSRGLVRLRMGDVPRAIRDYDAALALEPRLAWSLYGRGLAKRRAGQPGADADIAAATEVQHDLPDRARAIGLAP